MDALRIVAWVLLTVGILALWPWAKRDRFESVVTPEDKTYPPGCTCIRGALTDNPSCPHHHSTL